MAGDLRGMAFRLSSFHRLTNITNPSSQLSEDKDATRRETGI